MRIIVADAHDNFRNVLVELLRDEGHDASGVAHGGELVPTAVRVVPDVIVTHVRFPDLDALEALSYLARANVRIATVLMSGDLRAIPYAEAERLGVVAYLEKPFSINELRAALAEAARSSRKIA
jgi:CheY-like chemotaxis protein